MIFFLHKIYFNNCFYLQIDLKIKKLIIINTPKNYLYFQNQSITIPTLKHFGNIALKFHLKHIYMCY